MPGLYLSQVWIGEPQSTRHGNVQQVAEEHKMQMMDAMEKVKEKVSACNMEMKKANELFEKRKEEILALKVK